MSGELDPLAALAESRLADLWETTLTLLERGKAEDDANNGSAAVLLYSEAVGGLQALLELEENEKRLELLRARLAEYTSRLAQLRTALLQPARTSLADEAEDLANELWGTPRDTLSLQRQASQELKITSATAASAAAAPMASARMCAELAMLADEKGDNADAIDHYTEAVEWYLKALKLEPDEKEKAAARKATGVLLQRAEELKRGPHAAPPAAAAPAAAAPAPPAAAPTPAPAKPPAGQLLSEPEKAVLARSSKIRGLLVLPWLDDQHRERFAFREPWSDPDGTLALNKEQRDHFGRWARPSEFMRGEPKMIFLVSALTITQTIITDCSFVSSLVIAAAHERRFRKQLITNIIYPQDRKGQPIYNPAGKYVVKLHANGVERKVVVDDRIPLARDGQPMCSHSTHAEELWVTIIEKAYLKINGGYDFPGSNSGIDMFALTGWIPEQYRTDDDDFKPARLWERLCSASKYGDCLITVATGEMDEAEEKKWGLVPTHAYAVLQVREVGGVKLLQLKNPWARLRWKGAYSVHDRGRWTPALREALNYDVEAATRADNGIFWIDYGSLLKFYKGIYSNWNPALFRHHTATHGQWPKRQPNAASDEHTLAHSPQYALSVSVNAADGKSAAVWLLLTRHTVRKDDGKDDYLTVHVFKQRGGFRVYHIEEAWVQSVYSNRPHCLVKLSLPPGSHKLTLALAQYKPVSHQVDYTLDVYSMASFSLRPLPYTLRHTERCTGVWRGATAGGSPNHDTFIDNPRYLLTVGAPTDVLVEIETSSEVSLGVQGETEGAEPSHRPVIDSGSYRQAYAFAEARALPAGKYVLTVSTFDAGKEAPFALTVGSTAAPVTLAALPAEGSGLHRHVIRSEWSGAAAAGSPNHHHYERNPQIRLTLSRATDVLLRLRLPSRPSPRPALGLALFSGGGGRRLGADDARLSRALASTAVYSYPAGGALIPRQRLEAGSYVVVPSTFDPHQGKFELVVYAQAGAAAMEAL